MFETILGMLLIEGSMSACPHGFAASQNGCIDVNECAGEISNDAICQYSDKSATWENARTFCQRQGGDLLSPDTQEAVDLISALESDLWIGITFSQENWRYISSNETLVEDLERWVYGQAPSLRRKFRKIGEKSEKFNHLTDKTCVRKERFSGKWREADCQSLNRFVCNIPDVDCNQVNEQDGKILTSRNVCQTNEACTNTDGSYKCELITTKPQFDHTIWSTSAETTTLTMETTSTTALTTTTEVITTTISTTAADLTTSTAIITAKKIKEEDTLKKLPDIECEECWKFNELTNQCEPDESKLSVICEGSMMHFVFDSCIAGGVTDMTLNDDQCSPIKYNDTYYEVQTTLDGCGTTIATDDTSILFQNRLIGKAVRNNVILISNEFQLDFQCAYPKVIEHVETETTVHVSHYNGGHEGKGEFDFRLLMHSDNSFDGHKHSNALTSVGERVYFSLNIGTAINNLVFTITDCIVSADSESTSHQYPIIHDQCLDTFVNVQRSSLNDPSKINFSYKAFQFRQVMDTISTQKISCTVITCLSDDESSICNETPVCGN